MKRLVLLGVVLFLSTVSPAQGGLLLGNNAAGTLYNIDANTGLASNPRATGLNSLVGIAFSPGGTLYGLTTFAGTPTANALFTIDPMTGTSNLVGTTGLAHVFEGDLGFDPTSGILYGLQDVPSAGVRDLFTINTNTGLAAVIGNVNAPASDLSALAFDSSGNLFVIDTANSLLMHLNKSNAGILTTVSLNTSLGETAGSAFDPLTGTLFVADGGTGGTKKLYTLDTGTGILTQVGGTSTPDGMAGLSFQPNATSVPEPSTMVVMVSGGLGLAGAWWRKRRRGE
jgi:DNA-binding beta-propeller fold protein YncE